MPAWLWKKSTKSKDLQTNLQNSSSSNTIKASSIKSEKRRGGKTKENSISGGDNRKSFDEVSGIVSSRISPRKSSDFGGNGEGSSGFSGFDSSSSLDRVYPLPRPSVSSNDQGHAGVGLGSASVSGSSVSSNGSSDDHSNLDHGQVCIFR